jgi:hypothetical protein
MKLDEAKEKFNRRMVELAMRQLNIQERILELCRHLEPQLRDLKADHTADRLLILIDEHDRNEQDAVDAIRELIASLEREEKVH